MSNQVLTAIMDRRSHRAYSDVQLTDQQLKIILDAGLQAPSAVNRQPWFFSVVQNKELLCQMNKTARDSVMAGEGKKSPRFDDPNYDIFYGAPTVIFLSSPGNDANPYATLDCGIAVENMALAAQELGLGSVILGMPRFCFSEEKIEEYEKTLQFPKDWHFAIAIAIGNATDDKPAHPISDEKIAYVR